MKSSPRRGIGAPVAPPKNQEARPLSESKEAPDTTPEPLKCVRTARLRTQTDDNFPCLANRVQPVA